jgi:hypothetical protein
VQGCEKAKHGVSNAGGQSEMSYVALDIFQQLRPEDVHWMLATAELRTIAFNGVLVREDDPPTVCSKPISTAMRRAGGT